MFAHKSSVLFLLSVLISLSTACSHSVAPPVASVSPVLQAQTRAEVPSTPPLRLRIRQAEFEIASTELNRQFQSILALSQEKRLKDTVITPIPHTQLQIRGKLDASQYLPDIPFQITGELRVRPGNIIRFEAQDIRVVGIPVKGLLDILGLELANLAKLKDRFGRIEQQGNAFDLIVEKFTRDAIIEGDIKKISTSISGIQVYF